MDETINGDDGLVDQGYPIFSLMQKAPDQDSYRFAMNKPKWGTFADGGGKRGGFPQDHRTVYRAAGITRQSPDWPR